MRLVCDRTTATCVECNSDTDCAPAQVCGASSSCIAASDASAIDAGLHDAAPDAAADAPTVDSGACSPGPLGGVGVPSGSIATASAVYLMEIASHAIDADLVSRWTPGASTGWLRVDFSTPQMIDGLRLAASGGATEQFIVTAGSDPTPIGAATINVPSIASDSLPRQALPAIPVTPGTYTSITITIDAGTSWAEIAELSLLTPSCP